MFALSPLSSFIGLDECAGGQKTDIAQLKSRPLPCRRGEQRPHAELFEETPAVIRLAEQMQAVPIVGEVAAVRADHEVAHVVRAPDGRFGQGPEVAQIPLDSALVEE